jgi:hypothetical protein
MPNGHRLQSAKAAKAKEVAQDINLHEGKFEEAAGR